MKTKHKIKLTDLRLNDGSYGLPKNPRFIRDERFKKLCDSIRDFPEAMPARGIVVDERNVILGGNMRYQALKANGLTEIPTDWVKRADKLTPAQIRRFIIADNLPFGEWDFDVLSADFDVKELTEFGFDEKELLGNFDEDEPADAEPQIDKAAELNKKWKVRTGDLFGLGAYAKCPKCGKDHSIDAGSVQ
ncbi:MAG: hypothetical protein WC378_20420 [Opitutaceae bacterium]|jgi:hypothetical protein